MSVSCLRCTPTRHQLVFRVNIGMCDLGRLSTRLSCVVSFPRWLLSRLDMILRRDHDSSSMDRSAAAGCTVPGQALGTPQRRKRLRSLTHDVFACCLPRLTAYPSLISRCPSRVLSAAPCINRRALRHTSQETGERPGRGVQGRWEGDGPQGDRAGVQRAVHRGVRRGGERFVASKGKHQNKGSAWPWLLSR